MSFDPFTAGLSKVAATLPAGVPLVNGTPVIISWPAPNDGVLHRALIFSYFVVSSPETGGQVAYNINGLAVPLYSPNAAAGSYSNGPNGGIVLPGQVVNVQQFTALTAGASVLYAEIWAL